MLSADISYSDVEKRLKNLLGLLTEKERTAFEATYAVREYSKNEIIYHQGESPDHLPAQRLYHSTHISVNPSSVLSHGSRMSYDSIAML